MDIWIIEKSCVMLLLNHDFYWCIFKSFRAGTVYRRQFSHDKIQIEVLSRLQIDNVRLLSLRAPLASRHSVWPGIQHHVHVFSSL